MAKYLTPGNAKMYFYLLALLLVAGVWHLGGMINEKFSQLNVKQVPRVARVAQSITEKNFYPAWVKQSSAIKHAANQDMQIDPLFQSQPAKIAEPKMIEPDYASIFMASAKVDGIADDGVFINGEFIKVGQKIESLAQTDPRGRQVIPFLQSVKPDRIVFVVAGKPVVLHVGKV